MNIAVLFDERAPQNLGSVGHTVRQAVLGPGILQGSGRLITVRSGSVLLRYRKTPLEVLADATFFGDVWRRMDEARLRWAYRESQVFAWVISNVDKASAIALDVSLSSEGSYLGVHAVDLGIPIHIGIYRQMGLCLRVQSSSCWMFYRAWADEEGPDLQALEQLSTLGFEHVGREDIGMRGSVFDNFDSPDHFARLESLRTHLTSTLPGGADPADELLVLLEDLNPGLAATLGTAAKAYAQATSVEDYAQAGLSCRRYLSQLADELFPPQEEKIDGREVTRSKVINRLGAYIAEHIKNVHSESEIDLDRWGREVCRLNEEVCAAVHGDPSRERVRDAIRDLVLLTVWLLQMAPEENRRPYDAYATRVLDLARALTS